MRDHLVPPVLDTRGHPHLALPSSERHRDLLLPRRHLQHDPQLGRPFLQHCALLFLLSYSCRITLEEVILYILASRFGSNGDMIKQRIKLLQPIQDQVLTIIQEIAKEKKYDFIFDRSSEGTMLYSAKNYDISDLVIKRLNRNKKIQERKEKIEDLKNKAKN